MQQVAASQVRSHSSPCISTCEVNSMEGPLFDAFLMALLRDFHLNKDQARLEKILPEAWEFHAHSTAIVR